MNMMMMMMMMMMIVVVVVMMSLPEGFNVLYKAENNTHFFLGRNCLQP